MRKYKNICIDTGRYNVATSAVFIYDYCFVLLPSVELILAPVSVSLCWWRWSVCRCSLTSAVGSAAACSTAALQHCRRLGAASASSLRRHEVRNLEHMEDITLRLSCLEDISSWRCIDLISITLNIFNENISRASLVFRFQLPAYRWV